MINIEIVKQNNQINYQKWGIKMVFKKLIFVAILIGQANLSFGFNCCCSKKAVDVAMPTTGRIGDSHDNEL